MLIGLVGKPSSGKSTFFNAATLIDVARASYPFTTIEPNKGISFVRIDCVDKELGVQCNPRTGYCEKHQRFVPIELIDVAGLVPGAHKGLGKGNAFLSNLSKADILIQVLDVSGTTNEKGEPCEIGSYDVTTEIVFLEKEIEFWFFEIIQRNWGKFSKQNYVSKAKKLESMAQNLSGIGVKENHLDKAFLELKLDDKVLKEWTEEEQMLLAKKLREISKPIVIAANKIDMKSGKENLQKLKEKFPDKTIIPCSAESELALKKAARAGLIEYLPGDSEFKELQEMSEQQKQGLQLIQEKVLNEFQSTGVQILLNKTVFEVLNYIAVFPGGTNKLTDSQGRVLPDCFLLPNGSTALDFAFSLHSDIGKGFIRAINVKDKRTVGKEYKLKDKDVIEIIFKK